MTSNFGRTNPLIGLTEEEYKDLAGTLVSYVAFHATAEQTTYFMNLWRAYAREIAAKLALASKGGRHLVPVSASGGRPGPPVVVVRSALKKPRSH